MLFFVAVLSSCNFYIISYFLLFVNPFLKSFFQKVFNSVQFVFFNVLSFFSLSIISYQLSFVKTFLCEFFVNSLSRNFLPRFCFVRSLPRRLVYFSTFLSACQHLFDLSTFLIVIFAFLHRNRTIFTHNMPNNSVLYISCSRQRCQQRRH